MSHSPSILAVNRLDSTMVPTLSTVIGGYFASRLCFTFLFFQFDPQLGATVSLGLNLIVLLLVCFYVFNPARTFRHSSPYPSCVRWVGAFLCLAFLSLAWSETASIPVSLGYYSGIAADVLIVLLLIEGASAQEHMLNLIRGYVLGACLIACVMWLSPTMDDLRPGNDEFFSPNAIGFTCALGMFLAQFLMMRSRGWKLAAAFLAISLLRSLSKTTIIAVLVSQALMLFSSTTIRRRSKVLIVAGSILVLAAFSSLIAAYYEVYTNAGNQAETLTGRVGIWTYVLDRSFERPWLGHGFNSVWKVIPPFGPDRFQAWHAHNELLQQFYAYGVVGVLLLVLVYGSLYAQIRRLPQAAYKALFRSLMLFIVIRGLGDTERFDLSLPLWSIVLLGTLLAKLQDSASPIQRLRLSEVSR